MDALNEVSEGSATHSDRDILRLYELWLKTGSSRCYGKLKRLGVHPIQAGGTAFRALKRMLLSRLQELIGGIYDVRVAHDVYDFLVTDRGHLPAAARGGTAEEELIVAEAASEGEELAMSLYLDPALLERLARDDPLERLHSGNVADWWTALEGVSHFLYVAWNAGHDKPVSLIELEMQAEVDKYVASYWLLRRQRPRHFPAELRRLLFERTRIDPRAARRACISRPAATPTVSARGSNSVWRATRHGLRAGSVDHTAVLAELRRFYRLTHARKRALIEEFAPS